MQLGDIVRDVAKPEIVGPLVYVTKKGDGRVIYGINCPHSTGLEERQSVYESTNCLLAKEYSVEEWIGRLGTRVRCKDTGVVGTLEQYEKGGAKDRYFVLMTDTGRLLTSGITSCPVWRLGDVVRIKGDGEGDAPKLWMISSMHDDGYRLWRDDGGMFVLTGAFDNEAKMHKPMLVKGDRVVFATTSKYKATVISADNVENTCVIKYDVTASTDCVPCSNLRRI